ncbi:MAG: hypothetical protein ACTS3R_14625 [Inquilinaceae bacterium]
MEKYFPLVIGGVLPAFFWGITAVLQKLSATGGLGPGRYLTLFGAVIAVAGLVYAQATREPGWAGAGSTFAIAAGITFALGTGMLSFALWRYGVPISRVTPILGANVLVPVAIGLLFLGEGGQADPARLVGGTVLVIAGVGLVTTA